MTNPYKCFQTNVSIFIIIFLTNENNNSAVNAFKKTFVKKNETSSQVIDRTNQPHVRTNR